MIAEGAEFVEKVQATFFLQYTIDFGCGLGRLAPLFRHDLYLGVDSSPTRIAAAKAANPDYLFRLAGEWEVIGFGHALFAHDILRHLSEENAASAIARFRQPRIIVSEVLRERGFFWYTKAFEQNGYRFHRQTECRQDGGEELSFMEFLRKD